MFADEIVIKSFNILAKCRSATEQMHRLAFPGDVLVAQLGIPVARDVGIEHDDPALGDPKVLHVTADLIVGLLAVLLVEVLELHLDRVLAAAKEDAEVERAMAGSM